MNKLLLVLLVLGITFIPVVAQDQPTEKPSDEQLEKEKAEREKNAYRLLDQVIDEAQSLRLTENRVRVQINAADMLWDSNQGRARSLFAMAAEGVAELGRTPQGNNNRRGAPPMPERRSVQLRQELVLAAARHDAQLAYQLLASTKPPAQPVATDQRGPRQINVEENLEQTLLGRVAALDPKFAAQNAEQMIDKGQFPRTITQVINQLQKQDADAAAKLADKTVKKLQTTNLLTNNEATALAQLLLIPGPRPAASAATSSVRSDGPAPVLEQSAYVDLLGSVVDFALKATPPQALANAAAQRARPGPGGPGVRPAPNVQAQPTEPQLEQIAARRLLISLQIALPVIDQYMPAKATQIRQKLVEVGVGGPNSPVNMSQTMSVLQGNPTAAALVQAAAIAPPQMQSRLYQQAAYKALEEGNTAQARQIASDHLQANARDSVMQRIDFSEMAQKGAGARLDEIRQSVARLQTDNEKIDLLIQIARDTQKVNEKLATQLLEEARQLTNRRPTSYDQFEQQLKVARAFATLDTARSFEILDPGISQLNELMNAASVLNGFEVSMFRDGEMWMQGSSGLVSMINRYGQELALLAKTDFERAEALAGRFQFAEPRIMTRLSIVQGLLGVTPSASFSATGFRNFSDNVIIRPN
ncbi:MAG TPA: hypothetical protein VGW58_04980 [Pyrinomonadaceae bacterium]|nr:hypothetical protein [Pyrinomonadaceae bacterium]